MVKRMVLMLLSMAALLAAIGSFKVRQLRLEAAQGASFQPPPEAVTTIVAAKEEWPAALAAIGTVSAVQGVTVSADLPGIVERIAFESGHAVRQGDLLAELDSRQEQAQLAAAEADLELAGLDLERMSGLMREGVAPKAEHDRAAARRKQTEARAGEIRATIARKTIRAPFSGVLGIRLVDRGQYLRSGEPVVSLQALDPVYVDFWLPQQTAGQLRAGAEVRVAAGEAAGGELSGRIAAIDAVVNEATRNLRFQAVLANREGRLKPGMFVTVRAIQPAGEPVVSLPASAIRYAPFGDSVFVVGDLQDGQGRSYRGARQQFVKLGGGRGDRVAVLSGVEAGDEVVSSGAFKLNNGSAVLVKNQVQPGNDPAPEPEDN